MPSRISSRVGAAFCCSSDAAARIMPELQKPHWTAPCSMNAGLQRVRVLGRAEPSGGGDLAPVGLHGQREARVHRLAVEQHRAGAAVSLPAAVLDLDDAQLVAEDVDQRLVDLHRRAHRASVHLDLDLLHVHHALASRAVSVISRATTASATHPRYWAEARTSSIGAMCSWTSRAHSAATSSVISRPRRADSTARARTGTAATAPSPMRAARQVEPSSSISHAAHTTLMASAFRRPTFSNRPATGRPASGISTCVTISPGWRAVLR